MKIVILSRLFAEKIVPDITISDTQGYQQRFTVLEKKP
jgi:hypothetical protein